ncbi:hypothetical protein [Paenibacillus cookii]|uniref:Transcriptional regulator n=1 Tax=Paenibacillus cookii TaxID=157839 RepID=A0ABQ4LVT2_9BACL|nr:hypothetical protein [Paenibacillus cookii]KHF31741.1 hypothetical protein CM49_06032 [Paenibacillus sp. P1XP2]GIO67268.1 hypothetical protein J21TS3_20890 [Paenibacillus cookii]
MTLGKITLTNDEINEYNRLKKKIRDARTRLEVSLYTKQAEQILERGRLRYVSKLEQNKPQIKGIQEKSKPQVKNQPQEKKAKLSAYTAANQSYALPQSIRRTAFMGKLVKSNSGR